MSRRRKHSSRYSSDVKFASIPTEVLRSDACRSLPDYALRVLAAVSAQKWHDRGTGNGDIALTKPQASEYGVTPAWKLNAGLKLLVLTGLLERTRIGHIENGNGVASLYALSWLQIDASDKYDIPVLLARPAPNAWVDWKAPEDWQQTVEAVRRKAQGKKIAQTPRVTQAGQPGVSERGFLRTPRVTQEQPFPGQPGVSPLRSRPGAARNWRQPPPPSDSVPDLNSRIENLIRAQPHLQDADIGRVQQVRERLQRGEQGR